MRSGGGLRPVAEAVGARPASPTCPKSYSTIAFTAAKSRPGSISTSASPTTWRLLRRERGAPDAPTRSTATAKHCASTGRSPQPGQQPRASPHLSPPTGRWPGSRGARAPPPDRDALLSLVACARDALLGDGRRFRALVARALRSARGAARRLVPRRRDGRAGAADCAGKDG